MEQKLYTLQEVADLFRVTQRTVMNWEKRGEISFIYLPIGNMIRVTQEEVNRILDKSQPCKIMPDKD